VNSSSSSKRGLFALRALNATAFGFKYVRVNFVKLFSWINYRRLYNSESVAHMLPWCVIVLDYQHPQQTCCFRLNQCPSLTGSCKDKLLLTASVFGLKRPYASLNKNFIRKALGQYQARGWLAVTTSLFSPICGRLEGVWSVSLAG